MPHAPEVALSEVAIEGLKFGGKGLEHRLHARVPGPGVDFALIG